MKNISLSEIVAKRHLNMYDATELAEAMIEWAVSEMQLGKASPSLCLLAGMTKSDNFFEVENYFLKAIEELGITLPEGEQVSQEFLISHAKKICTALLNDEVSPLNASQELERLYDSSLYCGMNRKLSAWYSINMSYGWAFDTLDSDAFKKFEGEVRQAAIDFLQGKAPAQFEGEPFNDDAVSTSSLFAQPYSYYISQLGAVIIFSYFICGRTLGLQTMYFASVIFVTALGQEYVARRFPQLNRILLLLTAALFIFLIAGYCGAFRGILHR